MADDSKTPAPDGEKRDDAAFYQEEAKAAFKARDRAKDDLRKLQESGRIISDEQRERYATLEAAAERAEEERAAKAGEFAALKSQLTTRYQQDIDEREKKLASVTEKYKRNAVRAEFGAAVDYFSGAESSRTVLDVDMAMAVLGPYVVLEETEDGHRVVVKTPNGETITGRGGSPAPFSVAIGELIQALPNKDKILRGSGKTGGGSSGSTSVPSKDTDLVELTRRVQQGDKKAIEALKQRQAATGEMTYGRRPRVS